MEKRYSRRLLRIMFAAGAFTLLGLAVAYGTPYAAVDRCEAATWDYLRKYPVSGVGLDGRPISPEGDAVTTEIVGPFAVRTSYSVPRGLHATTYSHTCTAWPWRTRLGPREMVEHI